MNRLSKEVNWERAYKKYLEKIDSENYDICIAVTRKGYYFSKKFKELNVKVFRDRDILKRYTFEDFEGKKILVFDDTANTGETLKKMQETLESCTKAKKVDVAAFAISPWVLNRKKNLFMDSDFHFQCVFSEEEMTEFSLYELCSIHDAMTPYIVDLPVFKRSKFSEKQFMQLTYRDKENWKFYDYSFQLQGREYSSGFFVYENDALKRIFGETLVANVVKCRYNLKKRNQEEKIYEIVFTPFVILKSVNLQDIRKCFLKLYGDYEYGEYIQKSDSSEENYIGIYRDVVYNLSYFIGCLFKKYVYSKFNINLSLDYNLTDSYQNDVLIKSMVGTFTRLSVDAYMNRLNECRFTSRKLPKINIKADADTSFKMVRNYILGEFSLKKLNYVNERMRNDSSTKETMAGDILF